jgi:hypothetical protein
VRLALLARYLGALREPDAQAPAMLLPRPRATLRYRVLPVAPCLDRARHRMSAVEEGVFLRVLGSVNGGTINFVIINELIRL